MYGGGIVDSMNIHTQTVQHIVDLADGDSGLR
jgi:hypothetical protein